MRNGTPLETGRNNAECRVVAHTGTFAGRVIG
jgi:hypothetical protein